MSTGAQTRQGASWSRDALCERPAGSRRAAEQRRCSPGTRILHWEEESPLTLGFENQRRGGGGSPQESSQSVRLDTWSCKSQ